MAQKRLTAVGRVRGERVADDLHLRVQIARIGLQHADRDAHRGGHADRRSAADDHVPDGGRHLLVGAAGDVLFFERQARLVDHDHAVGVH